MTKQLTKRRPNPFDGSAGAWLCRMGLLTAAGDIEEAAMQVCTHIFAASFLMICATYTRIRRSCPGLWTRSASWRRAKTPSAFSCCCPCNTTGCASRGPIPSGGWQDTLLR